MDDNSDRTFIGGNRNPEKYGFSLRACNGVGPDEAEIGRAATLLGRPAFYRDDAGFECEIIAAAVHTDGKRVVYLESRARQEEQFVDIAIRIHFVDPTGDNKSVEIESYNPFFGCDVALIEWFSDEVVLLIYREKHRTYAYRVGDVWPPVFTEIDDRWLIKNDELCYIAYQAEVVQRLALPALTPLAEIAKADAEVSGQLPPDPYV